MSAVAETDRHDAAALRLVRPDSKLRRAATRPPAACGTEAGYHRHRRTTRTPPCDDCKRAHLEACTRRDVAAGRRSGERSRGELSPCGTSGAYQRHLKRGERPCDACAAFMRDESREKARTTFADPVRRERRARLGRERRYAKNELPGDYAPYLTAMEVSVATGVKLSTFVQWEDAWLEPVAIARHPWTLPRRLYDEPVVSMVREIVDLMHEHRFSPEAALVYMTEDVTPEEAEARARDER